MSPKLKKYLFAAALIVLLASTNFITAFLSNQDAIDPVAVQEIVDKGIPIVMGILSGVVIALVKNKSFEGIFTGMINNGMSTFTTASDAMRRSNIATDKTNLKITELEVEFKVISKSLREVLKLGKAIERIEKRQKLTALNDPNLVRQGVARQIADIDESDET